MSDKIANLKKGSKGKITKKYYYNVHFEYKVFRLNILKSGSLGWISKEHGIAYGYDKDHNLGLFISDIKQVVPLYHELLDIFSDNRIKPKKEKSRISQTYYSSLNFKQKIYARFVFEKLSYSFLGNDCDISLKLSGRIDCDENGNVL